jgi:hypothetical protein
VYEGTHTLSLELERSTRGDVLLYVMTLILAIAYAVFSSAGLH